MSRTQVDRVDEARVSHQDRHKHEAPSQKGTSTKTKRRRGHTLEETFEAQKQQEYGGATKNFAVRKRENSILRQNRKEIIFDPADWIAGSQLILRLDHI